MTEIDPWDSVLDIETDLYNEGYKEGQESALADGIIDHGHRAGFMKGYAIGIEVGFMESVIRSMQAKAGTSEESSDGIAVAASASRLTKRRADVIAKCETVPLTNVSDFDFPEEVRQIRTIYKQCGTPVEFQPRKTQEAKPTQEW